MNKRIIPLLLCIPLYTVLIYAGLSYYEMRSGIGREAAKLRELELVDSGEIQALKQQLADRMETPDVSEEIMGAHEMAGRIQEMAKQHGLNRGKWNTGDFTVSGNPGGIISFIHGLSASPSWKLESLSLRKTLKGLELRFSAVPAAGNPHLAASIPLETGRIERVFSTPPSPQTKTAALSRAKVQEESPAPQEIRYQYLGSLRDEKRGEQYYLKNLESGEIVKVHQLPQGGKIYGIN